MNEAFGQSGTAIIKLRAVEGPWDEDWCIAGSKALNESVWSSLNENPKLDRNFSSVLVRFFD